jgi:hypothetical protein
MKKAKLLLSTTEMVTMLIMLTKDGRLFILTRPSLSELKALTKNLVSTSIDPSTSDQECQ